MTLSWTTVSRNEIWCFELDAYRFKGVNQLKFEIAVVPMN